MPATTASPRALLYFFRGWSIPLDPVDAVRAALHLAHGGRQRHQGRAQAEPQGQHADARLFQALIQGLADHLVAGPRGQGQQRVADDEPDPLGVQGRREPGHRDRQRDQRQDELEAHGPGMAEAVAVPEPPEGLHSKSATAEAAQGRPGIGGIELVLGDA